MVQVQDNDYVQPEITVTSSSTGGDITYTIGKTKRTRKPWVYKSDYNKLQNKYRNAVMLAFLGWAFATCLWLLIMLQ